MPMVLGEGGSIIWAPDSAGEHWNNVDNSAKNRWLAAIEARGSSRKKLSGSGTEITVTCTKWPHPDARESKADDFGYLDAGSSSADNSRDVDGDAGV